MPSKSKTIAEIIELDGDIVVSALDNVDPSYVSDKDNSSTGQFTLPAGTTAQRPVTAYTGAQRFNTDLTVMEYYDGVSWKKVSAVLAVLNSVSGTLYAGSGTDLTLSGEGFLTANLVVNFTQSSDGVDVNVTVTPTSDTAATVTVPSSVFDNVTAGNAVSIRVTNSDQSQSGVVTSTVVALPSGGTITTYGNYRVHTFSSSSTLTVPSGFSTTMQALILAGGGGGGGTGVNGGGGGRDANAQGGSGTSGQGNNGGNAGGSSCSSAGGGGGKGQAGYNGENDCGTAYSNPNASRGGDGATNDYRTGSPIYYAGGGGGAYEDALDNNAQTPRGGNGGGGYAGERNAPTNAGAGTDGLGGGGGGGQTSAAGGDGGDGLVVIRYDVSGL